MDHFPPKLAESLALLESDDLPALGAIHGQFEGWIEELKANKSIILEEAQQGLQTITEVMLSDSQNPDADIEALRNKAQCWQKGKSALGSTNDKKNSDEKPLAQDPASFAADSIGMKTFMDHAGDVNQEIENLALEMEKEGPKEDLLEQVLRHLHNIKGEAGVLQLKDLGEICHELESACRPPLPERMSDILLIFSDWFDDSIIGCRSHNHHTSKDELLAIIRGDQQPELPKGEPDVVPLTQDPSFYMDFAAESAEHIDTAEQILLECSDNEISEEDINTIFRAFHTIKGVSGFLDLSDIQSLTHRAESVFDKMRSKQLAMNGDIHDLCFKVLDKAKQLLQVMKEHASSGTPIPKDPSIPAYLEQLDHVMTGDQAPTSSSEDPKPLPENNAPASSAKKSSDVSSVKVATDRLDQVINLVGELVTSHSMINEELQHNSSKSIQRNLSHMKKNVNELQSLAMGLRMVPIKSTFLKMSRIIRDLSKKMNKKIDFNMVGEDTELDRNMVDLLGDPLVHMVRNSADHGVESPEDRKASGKEETGHVTLKAFHKGGNIVIQIEDDGRGIDRDVILKKGIEKGMVSPTQEMSDNDVYQLLFAPGFSTAAQVTDVSGRGVGMDVVKKNIESLRGRIEIESKKGKGSTFSIHLPLTLAIIDGMVVRVGDGRYIVPTVSIDQTFGAHDQTLHTINGEGKVIKFRDHLVPILSFRQIFKDPTCQEDGNILMVLGAGEKKVAILVDEIVAQQEVVIKSLHESMRRIRGLSGSAILPDGTVGLILDPIEIASLLKEKSTPNHKD